MADVPASLYSWSTTTASNSPTSLTTIGAGLAPNLQEIQGAVRRALAYKGSDIAASSTTDLGAVDGLMHNITGTATITSFGTVAAGVWKVICFQGAPTITYNGTSMITPGAISITAAVNDVAIVQSLGSGNWRFISYTKASGLPVVSPTVAGPFTDASGLVMSASDSTKILRTRVVNLTTATTRNEWIADEDYNLGASWVQNNMTVTVTSSASAMTVAWKDKAGNDFSATNPLIGKFRSATATSGTYTALSVTGSFSITIPSGASLGTTNGVAHRIYFGRLNNAGVVQAFVYNPVSGVIHNGIRSQNLPSGVAISAGATSALTAYSSSSFTSCPIIVDGFFESSQATAGTWTSNPTYVHIFRPGDCQSGDIVQRLRVVNGAVSSGTLVIPYDDTIPQITEGNAVTSQAITPRHACDLIYVQGGIQYNVSQSDDVSGAMFNGSANAVVATTVNNNSLNTAREIVLTHAEIPNTTSAVTYSTRVGGASVATTVTINGIGGARRLGGVSNSYIEIQEVFV